MRQTQQEIVQAGRLGFVPPFLIAAANRAYATSTGRSNGSSGDTASATRTSSFLDASPWLDAIRPAARFQELLRKMNFPSDSGED